MLIGCELETSFSKFACECININTQIEQSYKVQCALILTIGIHIQLGKGVEGEHKAILGGGKTDITLQWRYCNLFSLVRIKTTQQKA